MYGDRHPEPGAQTARVVVTLATLRGDLSTGSIQSFSPNAVDHRVEPAERGAARMFAAESVAWVGFHRDPHASDPPASANAQPLRVHVHGGRQFMVRVDPASLNHPLGFFAACADAHGPFREVWFYHHGVKARELVEPIGSILMRRGVLAPERLARGLETQAAERAAPLGQILVEQRRLSPDAVVQAVELQKRSRMRIGEVLVEAGLATEEDINAALVEQKRRQGRKLGEVLVELGTITEADLAITLAEKFSVPFVDLDQATIEPAAVKAVPRELLEKHLMLPLAITERSVTIALADPLNTDGIDYVRLHLKRRVEEVLATPTQLKRFIAAALGNVDKGDGEFRKILAQLASEERASGVVGVADSAEPGTEDSAVIKLVNQVIADACRRGASDIHVEPYGEDRGVVVRFRIDGDCVVYQELPTSVRSSIVARIKVMANLDISERRKPQDGKIRFRFHDKVVELRVATIPTVNGNEDVVMRVLASSKPLPIGRLGFSERNLAAVKAAVAQPHGLILCVGPTGSGKTTTLHSLLGSINTPDMKIWTAEDPVEITQQGLRQVQVHPRIGFTFATALRAFLRADPDVIMVGEMRDLETATVTVEASLTGHLVFSTLHTNSAPETISRLIDMGLEPFTFGDALAGVLAQRLARGLCPKCVEHYHPDRREVDELEKWYGVPHPKIQALRDDPGATLPRAKGCAACGQTGYKGRIGLHEFLVVDDALRGAIQHKASVHELRVLAVAGGMTTLLQDGIMKALDGLTDLRQVTSVCGKG
jgi:type II secretory ATPase GspE/PulE/Tfp pilus assembly ATPase PilB-like protein